MIKMILNNRPSWLPAVLLSSMLGPTFYGMAQMDGDQTPSLASVAASLEPEFGTVRFHREEALEDRFGVALESPSAPHIYRVQEARFDRSEGKVRDRLAGSLPTMYVATLGPEKPLYQLAGFEKAEENFNRFVIDSPKQQIQTIRAAQSRGLLCAEVVYGLSPDWWLAGPSNAKLQAAQHFFSEGHQNALFLAEKWWNMAKGSRNRIKISTTTADGAFVLNLPIFWAPVEVHSEPEIKLYRIRVSSDGSCVTTNSPEIVLH